MLDDPRSKLVALTIDGGTIWGKSRVVDVYLCDYVDDHRERNGNCGNNRLSWGEISNVHQDRIGMPGL